jgi:hypothetical protein
VDGRDCDDDDEVPLEIVGRVRGSADASDRTSLEDLSAAG